MTTERATKAVNRLEKIGMFDYKCMEDLSKEMFIHQFEQIEESDIKPEFIKFLDMSDFRFSMVAPICRAVLNAEMKTQQKIIEKHLKQMAAAM